MEAYQTVCGELEAYGAGLDEKSQVLALNKIDAVEGKQLSKLQKKLEKASGGEVMLLSGASGEGLTAVLDRLFALVEAPTEEASEDATGTEPWSPI